MYKSFIDLAMNSVVGYSLCDAHGAWLTKP